MNNYCQINLVFKLHITKWEHDLIGLSDDGDAEEVDGVHVKGDGDDVE